ncbi:hypothetical protein PS2_003841 [Malus domestica]
MEGRRRLTLLDQMSASSNGRDLAGLSLDDLLLAPAAAKHPPPPPALPPTISGRTLLDIIRDEEPKSYRALIGKKDKKAWKSFKDRLLLKRAGSAWTSSVRVLTSDIPIRNTANYASNRHHHPRSHNSRRGSVRYVTPESNLDMTHQERQIARRGSTRFSPNASIPSDEVDADNPRASMFTRRSSVRFTADEVATDSPRRRLSAALEEERSLSAREAMAAQEAAEAAAAASAASEEAAEAEEETRNEMPSVETGAAAGTAEPVRMSLMDLLEETDRQMGVESRYTMDEDEDEECEEEEEEEEEEAAAEEGNVEYNCCVCMVRHKGAAFIPCGHTFCRMCSRELWVQRGNCPLCNNFILEILDIF